MRTSVTILLLIVLVPSARAHEDPFGYVHPKVIPVENEFHVYYRDLTAPREPKKGDRGIYDEYAALKDVYRIDGKLRQQAVEYGSSDTHQADYYAKREKQAINLYEQQPPPANNPNQLMNHLRAKKYDLRSLIVGEEPAVIASTYEHVKLGENKWRQDGKLMLAIGKAKGAPEIIVLGTPAYIYNMPRCSNLMEYNGKYYVAWVGDYSDAASEKKGYSMILSVWDPKTREEQKIRLENNAGSNTSISMNRIGDNLLIAWHQTDFNKVIADHKRGIRARHSFIHTVHVDLRRPDAKAVE
jgi:hypothetical protein